MQDSTPTESTPKLKILVVEDDLGLREALFLLMAKHSMFQGIVKEVQTAINGQDGFEKALSFVPDLIISDIKMPEMDGLSMGRALRGRGITTPIIYLSTSVCDPAFQQGLAEVTPHTLPKPIKPDAIREKILEVFPPRSS